MPVYRRGTPAQSIIELAQGRFEALEDQHDADIADISERITTDVEEAHTRIANVRDNLNAKRNVAIKEVNEKHDADVAALAAGIAANGETADAAHARIATVRDNLNAKRNAAIKALDEKYDADLKALSVQGRDGMQLTLTLTLLGRPFRFRAGMACSWS